MKNTKLEALEMMAGDNPPSKVREHTAECPKCGHKFKMGGKYESEEGEYEEEDTD